MNKPAYMTMEKIILKAVKMAPEAELYICNPTYQGDIVFRLRAKDLGLAFPWSSALKKPACVNTLGEALVMSHLWEFASGGYHESYGKFNHTDFGMAIYSTGWMEFRFHISLINNLFKSISVSIEDAVMVAAEVNKQKSCKE